MGMFDRVWFVCPSCEHAVEVQSKGGRCVLANFDQDSVPADIAESIENDWAYCESCNKTFVVTVAPRPATVSMVLRER